MQYVLTQHYTVEHADLYTLTKDININYAEHNNMDYMVDNTKRCPERSVWWEKIAWLRELLPTLEDDALILYMDCDSIGVGGDPKTILPMNSEYGMVELRGGLGNNTRMNWYNAGVIALSNTSNVRDFLDRVWNRNDATDETSINKELRACDKLIGDKSICSLDMKWNCWDNNKQHAIDSSICIKSWHGVDVVTKIGLIKTFLASKQ